MTASAIPKINSYMKSLEETRRLYRENYRLASPAKKPLRRVTNPSSPWKAMSAAGMALILSPDPFSDVVGIPLFLIGAGLAKMKSPASLSDVYKQRQRTAQMIKELKEGLGL